MGELNWAALAIPVFIIATLGEAWIAHKRGKDVYAFGTAVSDLACGSVFQAGELVLKLLTFGAYVWLYEHRWIDWPDGSVAPWVLGILGVDFLFYLWHRASHVVNVLWAVHGVHHHSEDYNLAVALRQPLFEPLTWFPFYAGLALLGVSPLIYLVAYGVNRVYQFWVHTELIRKLPPAVEWLLNTPSNHRVHHGVQPQYLDKNYGAVLMIWDRMFGTFEPEGETVRYGTTVPLRSYNPLWANVEHLRRTWELSRMSSMRMDALWAWFAHPAWTPTPRGSKPQRIDGAKYRPSVPPELRRYIAVHMGLAGLALGIVVLHEHAFPLGELLMVSTLLIAAFVSPTALIERRAWSLPFERARLSATLLAAGWVSYAIAHVSGWTALAGMLALAPLWLVSFRFLREHERAQATVAAAPPSA